MLGEFINCRENALRGRRSLRDLYNGFAASLPMVGIKIFHRDQRELLTEGIHQSRSDRSTRSGPGRTGPKVTSRRLGRKAMMRSVLFERGCLS